MKKILALIMILGIMLFAVGVASAAGYDANLTISGYEVGKHVLGLNVEIDNPVYEVLKDMTENGQIEAIITKKWPLERREDLLLEGTFQADTQYYVYTYLDYLPESNPPEEIIEAIRNAKFLFNGKEPISMKVYSWNGDVELLYELPAITTAPATGDAANIVLWTVLMAAGFAGMVMLLRRRRA